MSRELCPFRSSKGIKSDFYIGVDIANERFCLHQPGPRILRKDEPLET